ncbi:hypothetical protein V492_05839 [Pseudogymnoascus sp. VKM F-4246]|nr:hypothetical protein V492_05839 [Pseudogymnoascus sp. VKM F-4246]
MLNHLFEVTNGSTDNRPRQRLKDPDEKAKFEIPGSVNGSTIVREIQASSCKSKGAVLLAWADIEPWRQYNRFIIRSYRPASNSYLKSISSLGYIHDQTVNIYSHLLGAVGFVAAGWKLYGILAPRYHSATWADVAVFGAFAMGLFMCLTLSAAFHTFNNHSSTVYDYWFMLDMLGISFLIMGSFYPSIYYSFYCEPGPSFDVRDRPGESPDGLVLVYPGGSVAKVPERFAPGRFDVWGSSHQIFHVCVLLGAASHLTGVERGIAGNPTLRKAT